MGQIHILTCSDREKNEMVSNGSKHLMLTLTSGKSLSHLSTYSVFNGQAYVWFLFTSKVQAWPQGPFPSFCKVLVCQVDLSKPLAKEP